MANCSWLTLLVQIWLFTCFIGFTSGQSQNAVGAHRIFPKTSFSCADRPTGYYADIETGCQVYHMCDELGRQFSYSCPNTTLFQQRMLICDHWYMVNCSKAESDYTANLLIGQRDKPFVGDEENHVRTPRPDLLDRPYAPDYSGESFRNQYKTLPAIQNRIIDSDQRKEGSSKFQPDPDPSAAPTHWKIPKQPSREILPPGINPVNSGRFVHSATTPRQSTSIFTAKTQQQQLPPPAFNYRRKVDDTSDLGTSHSTRYNTTDDVTSSEVQSQSQSQQRNSIARPNSQVKIPSRVYEPPFTHSIYDQNGKQSTEKPLRTSTAKPFAIPSKSIATTTTTKQPSIRPTTLAGQPFILSNDRDASNLLTNKFTFSNQPNENEIKVAPSAQAFSTLRTTATNAGANRVELPADNLLPPHEAIVFHNTGTTEGPPIYYEWKIPSNGLLPPKLDPPSGANDQLSSTMDRSFINNPFINTFQRSATEVSTSRVPISRSIKDTAQPTTSKIGNRNLSLLPTTEPNIQQLKKELLIPDYVFPLETIGRTGYIPNSNTLNSFRLKIDNDQNIFEVVNPNCPQCHPSFAKPGTCEPCVRR